MAARDRWPVVAPLALCAGFALYACGSTATLPVNGSPDGSVGSGSSSVGSASSGTGSSSGGSTGSGSSGSGSSGASGSSASASSSMTSSVAGDASVLMYHKHINRDGFYVDSAFTKAKLQGATLHLDATFTPGGPFTGQVRASPLYVEAGYGGNPTFYVADESNNVYALSATGALLKTVSLGTGLTAEPCGTAHHVGIRGTPAIDTATGIMVLDAATGGTSVTKHTIYGLKISDLSTAWSLDASTVKSGTTAFVASNENQRSGVLIVNGIAYITYGGFIGDCGNYHGWVIGVPVSQTGTTASGAKGWMTSVGDAGIWAPGGPSSDGTSIYVATGNRPLGGTTGGTPGDGAFSVVRLSAGPAYSGSTNDYFYAMNDTGDEDLGGSGPLIVNPSGATPYVVQLGKDGTEYLLDTSKPLGGAVSPSLGSLKVMNDEITGGPGWANISGTTYVVMVGNNAGTGGANCPNGGSGQLVVTKTNPASTTTPVTMAWCANPHGGGSPIITTSDGTNDAMVWVAGATTRNDGGGGDSQLHAFDLTGTGAAVNTASDAFANVRHFTTPIVVHGRIFVAGDTKLYAYVP